MRNKICGNTHNKQLNITFIMRNELLDDDTVEEEKITMDSSFRQDLGADSLDTYELVYAIEEELGAPGHAHQSEHIHCPCRTENRAGSGHLCKLHYPDTGHSHHQR